MRLGPIPHPVTGIRVVGFKGWLVANRVLVVRVPVVVDHLRHTTQQRALGSCGGRAELCTISGKEVVSDDVGVEDGLDSHHAVAHPDPGGELGHTVERVAQCVAAGVIRGDVKCAHALAGEVGNVAPRLRAHGVWCVVGDDRLIVGGGVVTGHGPFLRRHDRSGMGRCSGCYVARPRSALRYT